MTDEQEWQIEEEKQSPVSTQKSERDANTQSFSSPHADIPVLLTSFVGREKECKVARTLLLRPEVRLLTFCGTGGIGKTRLALVVVNEVRSFFTDGVYFVPLASLSDAQLVLPTIAHTLEIQRAEEYSFLELLISNIREKHLLLLLDNFERVLDAATDIIAILKACPYLKILVTSRAILQVQGEYEFPVPPLVLPDLKHLPPLDCLARYPAIALFIQRAQALKHDFALTEQNASIIAELCVCLDGLPLAIELAAPRLKLLSLQGLLLRLKHPLHVLTDGSRDLHERQQTMLDTIRWSYDVLSPDEKKLFCRLSIFVNGFTIDAVEAVCPIDNDISLTMLDALTSLLNKSLIYRFEQAEGEPRLFMMEAVRDYGLALLTADNAEEVMRGQHAAYFFHWIEELEPVLYGRNLIFALALVKQERDNLGQALRWYILQAEYEKALRLCGATGRFWLLYGYLVMRSQFREGQRFFSCVIPLLDSQEISAQVRAKALLHYGMLVASLDDLAAAEMFGNKSLELYRQIDSNVGCMRAYWLLARCAQKRNSYEAARVFAEEALQLAIQFHDDFAKAFSLRCLGLLSFYTADYVQAYQHFETCLALAQQLQDPFFLAQVPRHLAELFYIQGNYKKARHFCEECLSASRSLTPTWNSVWSLTFVSNIEWREGNPEEAFQYAKKALDELTTSNVPQDILCSMLWAARIYAYRQQMSVAHHLSVNVIPEIKKEHDRWYCALFLEMLADVARLLKEYRWAVLLWGKASALREEIHVLSSPLDQADYAAAQIVARSELSEAFFTVLWTEGSRLYVDQILDLRDTALHSTESTLISPDTQKTIPLEGALSSLTRRELEVLRLLAAGLSNAQIAEHLTIARVTVNSYLRTIYSKLGVSSRTAAMRYAIDRHLL